MASTADFAHFGMAASSAKLVVASAFSVSLSALAIIAVISARVMRSFGRKLPSS
ncbi:hypothetical protein D3C71_2115910 [compost metagenome]